MRLRSDVVHRLLGDIFAGVLIAAGWGGYNQIVVSDRQTCMAHIFSRCRKIEESGGFLLFFIPRLRLNGV